MKKIIAYYNFIIVGLLVISSFATIKDHVQLAISVLFFPLFAYFALLIIPKKSKAIILPKIDLVPKEEKPLVATITSDTQDKFDSDRRTFLKLIGSAGLSVFFFALFTKKAEAAFFGSSPGPGTMALKDTSGNKIDPAEKQPTDGYKVSEIDDASYPAYYGFVNKSGAWFIQREDSAGAHRYTKGASDFATNWTNRASLTYDYFDNIF